VRRIPVLREVGAAKGPVSHYPAVSVVVPARN
jgi:hypothetical protein